MRPSLAFACLLALSAGSVQGEESLQAEIDCLLEHVRQSDMAFIRNGKSHDGEAAAEHMARKYDHFRKRVDSGEDFIAYAATKSTVSGRAYRVRLSDGEELDSADYLLEQLSVCRSSIRGHHP